MIEKSIVADNKIAVSKKENILKNSQSDEGNKNGLEKSFKEYAKSILNDSLITGLPQIISSTSWKKRLWKSTVFLVCLAGFLYQANEFMTYYWTFPTTTYSEVGRPYEVIQPAITFCSNNRRQAYCEMYPKYCDIYSNETEFCDLYPNYCKYNKGKDKKYLKVPSRQAFLENSFFYDWKIAEELGPTQSIIESCEKIYEGGVNDKGWKFNCSIRKFPIVTKSFPSYCYTIESQLGQPNSEKEVFPNYFYFKIELNTFPAEYFRHMDEILIFAAVHNRRHLISPHKKGITLKGGFEYKIHVSMNEIERLPSPYNTNCTDYLKQWRQNNGSGPLNQDTCIEYCKVQILKSQDLCIDGFTSYAPHTERMCLFKTRETTTYEMNKHCSMMCQPACLEQDYEFEYEEADLETKVIEDIELFSYIGGYIGIWLGISFVSICDLLESLCYLLYYACNTKKI